MRILLSLISSLLALSAADRPPVVSPSKPIRQAQDRPNIIFFLVDD